MISSALATIRTVATTASRRVSDVARDVVLFARDRVRQQLSRDIFPTQGPQAQEVAGQASAANAITRKLSQQAALDPDTTNVEVVAEINQMAQRYDVTSEELRTGLRSLRGASLAGGGSNQLNKPDPSIPQDAGVAAFFDVDNTLIKGASILLFARGLASRKFFTFREVAGFIWMQTKFRVLGKENSEDIANGRNQALSFVARLKESDVIQLAEEIWIAKIAERIFPGTKELAEMHLRAGHEVWLVTASPVQLAQVIARGLGFTGALGTVAEVKDGVFTGQLVGDILHGPGKKHAVLALASTEGLDLERCTAYSDSANDVPMLSLVGTAVAVNPDSRLRSIAKARQWEIRDYRRTRRVLRKFGAPAAAAAAAGAFGYWERRR